MKTVKEILEDLIKIGREWCEVTRKDGSGWKTYCNGFIECYLAELGEHEAIKIGVYGSDFEVSYNSVPTITVTIDTIDKLGVILESAKSLLAEHKKLWETKTEEELAEEKRLKIESLKAQLEELVA